MNGTATRFLRLGVSLAGLVTLGWVLTGHAAKPVRHSVPTDWSHRHLIFSHPATADRAARVSQDPRYWQQKYRREQRLALPVRAEAEMQAAVSQAAVTRKGVKFMSQPLHRDWSKNLGAGGSVGAGNFPAKFSFDTGSALCDAAGTPDYVAFSTGLAGSPTQASIVAYDNLYFGCGGATPLAYWAFDTAGTIKTSPVLSLDGTQLAFVQTNAGAATVVLLKWARGGTVDLPTTPLLVVPTLYSACIAPCMTEIPLFASGGVIPTDDTTSSVFYDYTNDIGWVGDASGGLHQISGMFLGTPTEVIGGGFPAQVNAGAALSSPVHERITNNIFVGDTGGILYRVDATSGAVVASGRLDFGVGIVEGPIVDPSNSAVYVFASSDASGNCGSGTGLDCAAVYKLATTFPAADTGSKVTVGDSSTTLGVGPLPNPMYVGGFDSAYYNSTNATGKLYVCGNTGAAPTVYQVAISAGAFPLSGQGLAVSPLATASAACSPVTDIPNPNLPGGFSERMFVSVQNNAKATACAGAGCILNFISAPWINDTVYVVGQQVLDTKGHVETVIQGGNSALLLPNEPVWTNQVANTVTDGNGSPQVIWIDQGLVNAGFVTWTPSFHYVSIRPKILDPNGNVQALTTNTGTSVTGVSQPAWSTVPGATTTDNQVTWTNVGKLGTAALPAAGGTSGIIVDNTVGPSTTGASQIYFSTLSDDVSGCGFTGVGGCAVQASQPGLN